MTESKWIIKKLLHLDSLRKIQKSIFKSYKRGFISLDVSQRSTAIADNHIAQWRFLTYLSTETSTVCSIEKIRDIVAIKLYPFISFLTPSEVANVVEPGKTMINYVTNMENVYTVLIHEFEAQSVISKEGRRYHFAMRPILYYAPPPPMEQRWEYISINKLDGWFKFDKPITEVSTFTITVGNPLNLIDFTSYMNIFFNLEIVYLDEVKD